MRSICGRRGRRWPPSRWRRSFEPQACYRYAAGQMGLDDLVDVLPVEDPVPDAFRIDHGHGAEFAAVEAARLVHAQLARTEQSEFLATLLRIGLEVRRTGGGTTKTSLIVALVDAEEDVTMVIAHCAPIIVGGRPDAAAGARRGRRSPHRARRSRWRRSAP